MQQEYEVLMFPKWHNIFEIILAREFLQLLPIYLVFVLFAIILGFTLEAKLVSSKHLT